MASTAVGSHRGGQPLNSISGSTTRASPDSATRASHVPAGTDAPVSSATPAKKRKHRGGKKRRNRRQSFAATGETIDADDMLSGDETRPSLADVNGQSRSRGGGSSFYQLQSNASNTSLESTALLDHRDQSPLQARRTSVQVAPMFQPRPSYSRDSRNSPSRPVTQNPLSRSKLSHQQRLSESEHEHEHKHEHARSDDNDDDDDDDDDDDADDRTPLISSSQRDTRASGSYGAPSAPSSRGRQRRGSKSSHGSGRLRPAFAQHHSQSNLGEYNVNNPPSMPASPVLGPDATFDDVMLTVDMEHGRSPDGSRPANRSRDVLIDIDDEGQPQKQRVASSAPKSSQGVSELRRRMTAMQAAEDVCFPLEGMSEMGEQDDIHRAESSETRRRRRRRWPDLTVLEAWSREETEQRTMEGMRTRKVSEPLMVGGRLRPQKRPWHREADDAPYRFTYFNEEFENTIHSQTIAELVQPGQTFRNLFIPDPPVIEDSTDGETDDEVEPITRDTTTQTNGNGHGNGPGNGPGNGSGNDHSRYPMQASSRLGDIKQTSSGEQTRATTPAHTPTPKPNNDKSREKPKRYGPRPAWWLDVLSPTDTEMKVISKAFGIHPLTAEDILMQEAREKVELFKHYYFINYRTFEQDESSDDYLEPVNLYVVVFREGVISFHFSMTPHPANVRRRIRQLQDYLILSPDWISYGIIDDITDAYAPLIQRIEEEVDDIDDAILQLHSEEDEQEAKKGKSASCNDPHCEKQEEANKEPQESGRNMLRRVGECRKKVMSLYRLLGNKADVIKGFAKRCNEQWDVAPRSEIGLYLGDIQDHIVTMTGNLSHYENLLSRAHSNYLAQINIRMNERQEKTSDILGKLTVLGTIVLPMNVVTGIWGMNCLVPGQDIENLNWFWGISAGLLMFGLSCYFIAKRVYGIV